MKKLILLIAFFNLVLGTLANEKADSLMYLLKNASEKNKADYLLELSLITRKDSSKSNSFARQAFQQAGKQHQALLQAKAIFYLAETFFDSNSYHEAIPVYQKALSMYLSFNDSLMAADCHKAIGLCYYQMDQGEKAITQFIEGMKLCENDKLMTAKLLSNIAMTHTRMKNLNEAIDYYHKALELNTAINNHNGMAVNFNGLGEIYKSLNQPDSALINYKKAKSLNKNEEFQAVTLSNMAGIYLNYRDSIFKSLDYYRQSWAIFHQLGMNQYEAEFKQGIGFILYRQGKFEAAIKAFKSSIEINDRYNRGFKIKTGSTKLISMAYEKKGDYQSALKYMKLYNAYSDSMAQNEKYNRIASLEKQYQNERNENEIIRLQAKQDLTLIELRKNKQLKQLGMVTVGLLLLFVIFVLIKYNEKRKSNTILMEKNKLIEESEHELQQLNASKNKFFSIIAHDLKNPLHSIMGYSYLLNKDYDRFSDSERRKFASSINQSTNNIFRLLQNLLEWSKSQTGKLNYSPMLVDYQRVLDNSLNVLQSLAEQKNIRIRAENDPELKIYADPLMIETVLRNLINNAIKFTPEGGQIDVSAKINNDHIQVTVKDSGIGISEEESKNLFRIDSKVKRKGTRDEDGSGLGLILCHEFVSKHHGNIWVESTLGKGSEFTFSIPVKFVA